MRHYPLFFVLVILFFVAQADVQAEELSPKELRVERVTPQGEDVGAEKQIVIQFNRAVVPIGRMERDASEVPITITPTVACQWRWLNTSALACQLDEKNALTKATKYTLTLNQGIKAEDGGTLAAPYTHTFIMQRPDVQEIDFKQWRAAGAPVLKITFNQAVTAESVQKALVLTKGDEKFSFDLREDEDAQEASSGATEEKAGSWALLRWIRKQFSDDAPLKVDGKEARRVWLLEPTQELPLDSAFILKGTAGLVGEGSEHGVTNRELLRFDTLPPFAFLGVSCTTNAGKPIVFNAQTTQQEKCNPMNTVALQFSSPVLPKIIKEQMQFTPDLSKGLESGENWGDGGSRLAEPYKKGNVYSVYLPFGLKAAATYTLRAKADTPDYFTKQWRAFKALWREEQPDVFADEFGRSLATDIALAFITDHRPPNAQLVYNTAVLETGIKSDAPLYVNNIESTSFTYAKLSASGTATKQTATLQIPAVKDVQFAVPLKVREMLEGKSGAVYGTLSTTPATESQYLFAQVTPYQVQVKLGHFNTMVWVIDMATGQPVANAQVDIYKDVLTHLSNTPALLTTAITDGSGVALLAGTQTLDPALKLRWTSEREENLFVRVTQQDAIALMPLNYDFAMSSYRTTGESIYPEPQENYGHIKTWGTTAQGIYRAGDTIQYKFYVRNQDNNALIAAPKDGYSLAILDPLGKKVEEIKHVTLNEFGSYAGEFTVPKNAAVGWYRFRLTANFATRDSNNYTEEGEETGKFNWYPLRVLVSDFTPSPFKVTTQLNGDLFRGTETIEATTTAKLHSGGAYTDAAVKITAMLSSKDFTSKHRVAKGFSFTGHSTENDGENQVFQKNDTLGATGEITIKFSLPEQSVAFGRLMVESAVQDDRGKSIASQSYADYAGVDRFIGLKIENWVWQASVPSTAHYLVVNEQGVPVAGSNVTLLFEREETKAARVKGAGNAYLTEFHTEWVKAGDCSGISQAASTACSFTPEKAGYYRLTATVTDTKGRMHTNETTLYAVGKGDVVWNTEEENALEIIPEKPTWQVGDTAKFLVKNPYPNAKALITIERYGVIDHFVQTLEGSTPVVQFPVKASYLPGFYMSVTVFSPRVEKPLQDTDKPVELQLDLGKPTFRIGYVKVPLDDPHKEITVVAQSDKAVYKPRETVTVSLHATPRHADKKEPIELAVVVLDEAVFDLLQGGKKYFDPYDGFYQLEGLDVRNYSLLMRLVGRQAFMTKGANQGGDGGRDLATRNQFKFVSYWNPSLKTDANGKATVTFPVPDNLTGWRVLAMAVTPSDRMGLGEANFTVNKPTEIRPVMPNQLTEGDSFDADFSVMNRTDKTRTLSVTLTATGSVEQAKTTQVITLEPYKRKTVFLSLKSNAVGNDTPQGAIDFRATAVDAIDGDALTHTVVVNKRRSLETAAHYGSTTENRVEESLKFPQKIHTDVGSVSVVASPSVLGNIAGAFDYIRTYPYSCWEQRLTKAVMASHFTQLNAYLPETLTWQEAKELPQQTLATAASSQAPNGGMTYFVAQDQYVDPYLSAYTAVAFNGLRQAGYIIPVAVEEKLHAYLAGLLRQDAFPSFYSDGMAATVRAVALAALAEQGKVTAADIERYRPHLPHMSLFGKTFFMQAALALKSDVKDVVPMILSTANESAGKITFSEALDDSYDRILASPLRENCAILSVFSDYATTAAGKSSVGEVPMKLARMITQARGSRDHWENTQENLFCLQALVDYAKTFEAVKPSMTVRAALDAKTFGEATFSSVKDAAVTFTRPLEAGDAGRNASVQIERTGTGRLYYATKMQYAPLEESATDTNAGIEIHREYSVEREGAWVLLSAPVALKAGELVRVDLYISVPAARNFVVVDDPVAGGLEPVNRDLATASVIDAKKGDFTAAGGSWYFKFNDWVGYNAARWSFYHQELRHDAVRFYADYLPAGNYHLSYTAQAIAAGQFLSMPVMAEEMYDSDVYGKGVPVQMTIKPLQATP